MEIFRALAVMVEPPDRPGFDRVSAALGLGEPPDASAYTETFVFQLYPYASVYLGSEGMLGGEARDRVAGFRRALGQTPTAEPDHLPSMLALYARLCELDEERSDETQRASWRNARRAFLWEHLLSWLPVYLDKLVEIAPPFYRRWGEILNEALTEEAIKIGPQESLPLALREASATADPRESSSREFISSLLAPARSGIVLTRADLTRAAKELALGMRAGERRFALESLMGQDASALLGWLAREADGWTQRHARRTEPLGIVAGWWRERAAGTATLLRKLKADADG